MVDRLSGLWKVILLLRLQESNFLRSIHLEFTTMFVSNQCEAHRI